MATQTIEQFRDDHFIDGQPDGTRLLTYDYDDVTLFMTRVTMLNTTSNVPFPGKATVIANGRTFSHTEPAGGAGAVPFTQNIPTNAANRFQLVFNQTKQRLDGVDWNIG